MTGQLVQAVAQEHINQFLRDAQQARRVAEVSVARRPRINLRGLTSALGLRKGGGAVPAATR